MQLEIICHELDSVGSTSLRRDIIPGAFMICCILLIQKINWQMWQTVVITRVLHLAQSLEEFLII